MKFRIVEEKENKKTLDLDEALGLKEHGKSFPKRIKRDGETFTLIPETEQDDGARYRGKGGQVEISYREAKKQAIEETLQEDTIKQNGKWVNKGKEGTHGTFKTKKEADAQRKAMFARGFKEDLEECIYLFPELTEEDKEELHNYGLAYLGKNHFEGSTSDVVKGSKEDLIRYGKEYLDYILHPDYLYKEEDFAGEIVNEKLERNEISDFFDKAKRLGVETLGQLKDLLAQEESKGNNEKEKIDAYADAIELGDDTLSNESLKEDKGVISDTEIFDILGIEESNRDKEEYQKLLPQFRELAKEHNAEDIWLKDDFNIYAKGEITDSTDDLVVIETKMAEIYEDDCDDLDEKLIQGKSEETVRKNTETEIKAGKSPEQAYAIAKSIQKKNEQLEQEINQKEIDVDKVIDLKDKIEDCKDPKEKKKIEEDSEIVDYFDNSVHDEDIIEDDFDEKHDEIESKETIKESFDDEPYVELGNGSSVEEIRKLCGGTGNVNLDTIQVESVNMENNNTSVNGNVENPNIDDEPVVDFVNENMSAVPQEAKAVDLEKI